MKRKKRGRVPGEAAATINQRREFYHRTPNVSRETIGRLLLVAFQQRTARQRRNGLAVLESALWAFYGDRAGGRG